MAGTVIPVNSYGKNGRLVIVTRRKKERQAEILGKIL
jgi:hypothetical protein